MRHRLEYLAVRLFTALVSWLPFPIVESLGTSVGLMAYVVDAKHRRIVLSDWDAEARPPRLEALRLHADGRSERVKLA